MVHTTLTKKVRFVLPISEAQKRANKKWNDAHRKERYDYINLVVPKGKKEIIKDAANACGQSVNAFINYAINTTIQRRTFLERGKTESISKTCKDTGNQ